ncbi:MAG: hypothetical protein RLN88_00500 [Ekhidna sp.]|uniref:hypothetical protein n=1 Tax=Ekhidna sp. TaxID=2608089 RepID=UPI0032F04696
MKKSLLTVTLVAFFGVVHAQIEKGGWLIGPNSNLGFSSTSFDGSGDNVTSFNIGGKAGYFLIDNLVAGVNVGFSSVKQGDSKSTSTQIGPFARYYVSGIFFLGASFSAASSKLDSGIGEAKITYNVLAFEGGYPIWIVDNIAIEPALNYTMSSGDDIIDRNTFGLNIGFTLYF